MAADLDVRARAVIDRILELALEADATQPEVLVAGLRAVEMLLEQRIVSIGGDPAGKGSTPVTVGSPVRVVVRVPGDHPAFVEATGERCTRAIDRIEREYGFRPPVVGIEPDPQAAGCEVTFDELHVGRCGEDLDELERVVHDVLESRMSHLLTRDETACLLDEARGSSPMLVQELVPNLLALGQLQQALARLLAERVPIRRMTTILHALADQSVYTKDPIALADRVREQLGETIVARYADEDGGIAAVMLAPDVERALESSVRLGEQGQVLMLDPAVATELRAAFDRAIAAHPDRLAPPIVVVPPKLRRHVRAFFATSCADVVVLGISELPAGTTVDALATLDVPGLDVPASDQRAVELGGSSDWNW